MLDDVPAYVSEYAPKDWDVRMRKMPTVTGYAQSGLAPRDLVLGIRAFGASRAFLYDAVSRDTLVQDHVGSGQVILVVGPDGQSVRAFERRVPGLTAIPEFYRVPPQQALERAATATLLIDDLTGSGWNFQGCAISGKSRGACLDRVGVIKDYWFDWRRYNPLTTIYRGQPH